MASAVSSRFAAGSPSTGVSWQQATTVVSTASTSWHYLLPPICHYPDLGRRPGGDDGLPWAAARGDDHVAPGPLSLASGQDQAVHQIPRTGTSRSGGSAPCLGRFRPATFITCGSR